MRDLVNHLKLILFFRQLSGYGYRLGRYLKWDFILVLHKFIFLIGGVLEYDLLARSEIEPLQLFPRIYAIRNLLFYFLALCASIKLPDPGKLTTDQPDIPALKPYRLIGGIYLDPNVFLNKQIAALVLIIPAFDTNYRILTHRLGMNFILSIENRYFFGFSSPQHFAFGFIFTLLLIRMIKFARSNPLSNRISVQVQTVLVSSLILFTILLVWEFIEFKNPISFPSQDLAADLMSGILGWFVFLIFYSKRCREKR